MDIEFEERQELFAHKLSKFKKEEIMKFLVCQLCEGMFRFAHTILDCGHTFCKLCIFNYIRGFKGKNPEIKCPQCHTIIETNYKKSIAKDVYKQAIVDLIEPKFAVEEEQIVKRVSELFPQCNISFLLEQFSYAVLESAQYRKRNKINFQQTVKVLPELVKERLGISFDVFVEKIYSEQCFNEFKLKLKNKEEAVVEDTNSNKIINIHPRSDKDFQSVNIKNQIATQNNNILKLRRFLEKKMLEHVKTTGKIPTNLIKKDDKGLTIEIFLWVKDRKIENTDDINELRRQYGDSLTIEYSIQP